MLPYINAPFVSVANALGASVDELKLIFSFLISYPLAAVLKRIPDKNSWQKNVFSITVCMFYLVGLFDLWDGLQTVLISSIWTYIIAKYIKGPFMPWVGFVFLMLHMSWNHIKRQAANDPSTVDITGAQMVMLMKLSAFCWNVYDGTLPESKLSDFQKERAIRELPDLLDYFGYVFFFPSFMIGPAFDYNDYHNYISTTMFTLPAGTDPSLAPKTRKKRRIPRSGTPAAYKAAQGLAWIFAFLKFGAGYNADTLLSPSFFQYNFLRRIWILHMVGFTVRMKYYGVWSLTEGACILSGIGYRGIDPVTKRPAWDRLQNIRPYDIELAQNSHAYLGNWNINTNHWLRNYVYLRVTPKGKKPGFPATVTTFATSAFWHGFYPGYYMAFVFASFVQTVSKNARKLLRPFFLDSTGKPTSQKIYYDIFSWLITQATFSFTVAPFYLLQFNTTMTVWSRVYFYAIVGVALSFAFLNSPGKTALVRELKKRNPEMAGDTKEKSGLEKGVDVKTTLVGGDGKEGVRSGANDSMQQVREQIEMAARKGEATGAGLDVRGMMENMHKQRRESGARKM